MRPVIFESLKLIETKHIHMHISGCRSMTKIAHSRVSLYKNEYVHGIKYKRMRFNFVRKKYTAVVFFVKLYKFLHRIVFFSFELLQNGMDICIHYRGL